MIVSKTRYENRIMVLAPERLSIPLVRIRGRWFRGTFGAYDLQENFYRVTDPDEAEAFFEAAAAALAGDPTIMDSIWNYGGNHAVANK